MISRSFLQTNQLWRLSIRLVALILMTCFLSADEKDPLAKSREEELAARRLELMHDRVTAAKVESAEAGFPKQFDDKPIFRYNDPARGYVSAAVWKLGDEGRPKAIIASELDRTTYGKPCISYEFISLTTTAFSVTSADVRWKPSATLLEFKPVPKGPAVESTASRRLRQLREIANRFSSYEEVKREPCELRLLPAPVLRYTPSQAANADGAIFLFTYGTNPEVMLLIESDGQRWNYAAGRMTGAELVELKLDGVAVWQGAPLKSGIDSPFTGSITAIDIPGIAKDGSALPE